jgi:hypothetical protein
MDHSTITLLNSWILIKLKSSGIRALQIASGIQDRIYQGDLIKNCKSQNLTSMMLKEKVK